MRRLSLPLTFLALAAAFAVGASMVTDSARAADEEESVSYSADGADTCVACHDEDYDYPVFAIFKSKHANISDERTPFAQFQCESCHGPGGAHTGRVRRGEERPNMRTFGSGKETPVAEQNEVCSDCHQQELGVGWHGGPHEASEIACADCHTVHTARDPVFEVEAQPEVCFECHRQQRAETYKFSVHPIRVGKMACSACHDPHGSLAEFQLVRDNLNETCYSCHTEKRGPFLWEHPPVAEDCSLCHNPHGSNHPALLTRRPPLLCQQCHSQAGHPSVPYTSDGLPPNGASSFLLSGSCLNCHSQVHGSNHPSGPRLTR